MIFGTKQYHEVKEVVHGDIRVPFGGLEPPRAYADHHVPENEYQALMEAAPLAPIQMTEGEREADWLLFQEKLDAAHLSEREQVVLDSVVFGGMTLTDTADLLARMEGKNEAMSKTSIARIRDRAFSKLRKVFENELL